MQASQTSEFILNVKKRLFGSEYLRDTGRRNGK